MKNLVAIFGGHDANITFYNAETNKYYVIELERLVKKRYFRLHVNNSKEEQYNILKQCQIIAEKNWGIKNDFEKVLICSDGFIQFDISTIFNTRDIITVASHHHCHAASSFYQSPFSQALILSYDGGGDDGFFNVYVGNETGVKHIKKIDCDFGGGYLLAGSTVREVAEKSSHMLAFSGKLMGLCAYGKNIEELNDSFKDLYLHRDYKKLIDSIDLTDENLLQKFKKATRMEDLLELKLEALRNPWKNPLGNWIYEGKQAYDIAATAQAAFEEAFFDILDRFDNNIPLVLTGGCALNVLVNEKVKERYNRPVYVPPNPHDGGLSLGHIFLYRKPTERVDVTYNGLPLVDRDKLPDYIQKYNARKTNKAEIAKLIKDGKILGLVYGDSEVGPRALGNRSIVCDPNIPDMKDILNSKVKFREWYRPFAPFCKKEDAHKYFDSPNFDNLEYMSYAPRVKVDTLPSITHVDGTARLQTVTEESHSHFYELLTEFGKLSDTNVLLNTSFNIRGYPILSTIEDALYALENTEMDYVVIEDYLFTS